VAERVKLPFKLISLWLTMDELISDDEPEDVKRLKREVEKLKKETVKLSSKLQGLLRGQESRMKDHEKWARK